MFLQYSNDNNLSSSTEFMDKGRDFVAHFHFISFVQKVMKLEMSCEAMVREVLWTKLSAPPKFLC